MSQTTLSRMLSLLEESPGALTLRDLAEELEVRPERVEGLVDFWVNKGRIRISSPGSECSGCSAQGGCPLIINLPRRYELVPDAEIGNPVDAPCRFN